MRRGRHAADDGSFGRSAGAAVGRGVVLLALALLIGVVLLNAVDAEPPGQQVTSAGNGRSDGGDGDDQRTDTTQPPSTETPVRPPAEVKVLVANASGVNRAAASVSERLQPEGYALLTPANATTRVQDPIVYFAPGFQAEAAAVAGALGLDPSVVQELPAAPPVRDLQGANVVVLVDDDLARASQQQATTTTTAAG